LGGGIVRVTGGPDQKGSLAPAKKDDCRRSGAHLHKLKKEKRRKDERYHPIKA